ncbi:MULTISPECIES: vitamin B12 ABC transporter ATP-binding protein BtuD [Providencia]|uniref:vitamin B12 ABC transporter ATP-binding protein BtuD n=1 Tax=Providencia TaxID=586 RepID=UPI0015EB4084|nr:MULTISPECIES: ATP-binding cassette domain-containing protein [Providencia]QLQ66576.1 ATP-binding cassette domain-containing protein [Providencia rettgeri]URR23343.1 ATP-binding cassette domain-containing protein [Providencia rettgeri]
MVRNQPIIDIKNICAGQRLINFSAQVFSGEQIHLLGANGAGKSTLLEALSGYLPVEGEIIINRIPLQQYRVSQLTTQRAYLPQLVSQIPILKVFQYLELFLPNMKLSAAIFERLCTDFQLTPLLRKPLVQLSGGEWQRVRITATFLQVWDDGAFSGKYLLFDEPMNNLDIVQQAMLDKWTKNFCDCSGTVIMSGHDLSHSYKNASNIWMMKQGRLTVTGKPENVMTEKNLSDIFMSEIKLSQSTSNRMWQIINLSD